VCGVTVRPIILALVLTATIAACTSQGRTVSPAVPDHLVTADGRTRTFVVHVPDPLPSGPLPLVVALHGGTGSAAQFQRTSGFDTLADERGFLVVYPDGVGNGADEAALRTWNAGDCCGPAVKKQVDDVGFIGALVDLMERTFDIDPGAVFATGHSNGGFMSDRLACELADRIVAVGFQSGGLTVPTCSPSRPVSVVHIHGSADQNVLVDGGVGPDGISKVDFPPLAESMRRVSAAMGCASDPATSTTGIATTSTWASCDADVTVQLVLVDGKAHKWMSGPDFDSATTIVDFLLRHRREVASQ
jgi:polyhydroxybutyrate depolymerase